MLNAQSSLLKVFKNKINFEYKLFSIKTHSSRLPLDDNENDNRNSLKSTLPE
jgi:hypothetical protein